MTSVVSPPPLRSHHFEEPKGSGKFSVQYTGWFHQVWTALNALQATSLVAGLPTKPFAGMRRFVTDATATTFNSIVAGTGAHGVPVFYDGTNWRIG